MSEEMSANSMYDERGADRQRALTQARLVILGMGRLPRVERARRGGELDVGGAVTATAGLTAAVWGLIRSDDAGWGSTAVLVAFALAAILLAAFALLETRVARAPLLPFSVLRSRPLWAGNLLSFLSFVPVTATWFLLTLYLQDARGFGPMETGLLVPTAIDRRDRRLAGQLPRDRPHEQQNCCSPVA
jgi:hypothetical protein